jgi:hypothetical protein
MSAFGWEDIRQSTHGTQILRYKTDITALDATIRALEGLLDTMAMHLDLKSRCWIPLITASMPQLVALRQQLPPVSNFYQETEPPPSSNSDDDPGNLVRTVNTSQFLSHYTNSAQVMAELKAVLAAMRAKLDEWHVQEFGNITLIEDHPEGERDWSNTWKFLEDSIWNSYTTAYAILMSGEPAPGQPAPTDSTLTQQAHLAPLLRRMRDFHT